MIPRGAWRILAKLGARRVFRLTNLGLVAALAIVTLLLLTGFGVDAALSERGARLDERTILRADEVLAVPAYIAHEGAVVGLVHSWEGGLGIDDLHPGQVLVSTALAQALELPGDGARELRARIPGDIVGSPPPGFLLGPTEQVAIIAHQGDAPSIQTAGETSAAGPVVGSRAVTIMLLLLTLTPALILAVIAARFGSREREHELATLRIAGARRSQLSVLAAAEGALVGVPAAAIGLALGALALPFVRLVQVGDLSFYVSDVIPAPASVALALAAAPLAGWMAGAISVRDVVRNPLRHAGVPAESGMRARILPLALGIATFIAGTSLSRVIPEGALVVLELGGIVLILVGLVLAGPALVSLSARSLAKYWPSVGAGYIACRRLEAAPRASFRPVVGLLLSSFIFGFVAVLDFASNAGEVADNGDTVLQVELPGPAGGDVTSALRHQAGIESIAPLAYRILAEGTIVAITTCEGLTTALRVELSQGACRDGSAVNLTSSGAFAGQRVIDMSEEFPDHHQPIVISGTAPVDAVTSTVADPTASVTSRVLSGVDLAWTLSEEEVNETMNPVRLVVRTTDQAAFQRAIAVVSVASPLARTGRPLDVDAPGPVGSRIEGVFGLLFIVVLLLASAAACLTAADVLVRKRTIMSLLHVLGATRRSLGRIALVELGIPLFVATYPPTLLGIGLALVGGRLVGGNVRAPGSGIVVAMAVTTCVAVCAIALLVAVLKRVPRVDALGELG